MLLTNSLYDALTNWVRKHYRDHLLAADLQDPLLADESRASLDDLAQLLDLPVISQP